MVYNTSLAANTILGEYHCVNSFHIFQSKNFAKKTVTKLCIPKGPIFPRIYIPSDLCSNHCMFPGFMFQGTHCFQCPVSQTLQFSQSPSFLWLYVSKPLCSLGSSFSWTFLPYVLKCLLYVSRHCIQRIVCSKALSSEAPMFQRYLYI